MIKKLHCIRTLKRKPTLPIYILQSLQGHLCVVRSLIPFLDNSSDAAFFIALRTNSQIFGAREDTVYLQKHNE